MDGTQKQIIAIAVVCGLLAGLVGAMAVCALQEDVPSGQAFVSIQENIENPNRIYVYVVSSADGYVDIYHKDWTSKPWLTLYVEKGENFHSCEKPTKYTITDESVRCVWYPA